MLIVLYCDIIIIVAYVLNVATPRGVADGVGDGSPMRGCQFLYSNNDNSYIILLLFCAAYP